MMFLCLLAEESLTQTEPQGRGGEGEGGGRGGGDGGDSVLLVEAEACLLWWKEKGTDP